MTKEKDFIEIEYTGKTGGIVFDTTDKEVAKKNGLPETGAPVICIGQGHILSGLDEQLKGKEIGKEYAVTLQPEQAFGKKSAKLVQLVPTNKFIKNQVMPQPGLQVNIDGMNGIIKTVSGGRTLVDFNHPLSGKAVEYTFKIIRKVDNDEEKLKGLLKQTFGNEITATLADGKAVVDMKLQKEIAEEVNKKIKDLIPSITDIMWEKKEVKKQEKAEANKV